MKRILTTILFFTLLTVNSLNSCPPPQRLSEQRQQEYENSGLVFIGRITELSQLEGTFKVITEEIFKGGLVENQKIIGKIGFEEPAPEKPGVWLIYGELVEGELIINACGLSRDLKRPFDNHYFNNPMLPPHPNEQISPQELIKKERDWKEQQRIRSFTEIEIELEILRSKNK